MAKRGGELEVEWESPESSYSLAHRLSTAVKLIQNLKKLQSINSVQARSAFDELYGDVLSYIGGAVDCLAKVFY
ncbi:hypothetical protein GGI11_001590 [Coemansia sp. RSA 2049]|nr:hypothetical protein LPJ72_005894 [Coemansia sp. Benny D160-2]KAJ2522958.1 hypothetical protein GGI11_001590 [Coemansia sp. RSA 2049]